MRRRFPAFLIYEHLFDQAYRFSNPYRICKTHLQQTGAANVHAYGETPLPALAQIALECELNSDDVLIELGCGRGRGAFFLSHLTGCRVIGIDWIPFFIRTAEILLASVHPRLRVSFRCEEMQKADFAGATAIYLFGTCLCDETINTLIQRFRTLPSSTKIITVSYPLSDYSPHFKTVKQFAVTYPWGEGEVFLNTLSEEALHLRL